MTKEQAPPQFAPMSSSDMENALGQLVNMFRGLKRAEELVAGLRGVESHCGMVQGHLEEARVVLAAIEASTAKARGERDAAKAEAQAEKARAAEQIEAIQLEVSEAKAKSIVDIKALDQAYATAVAVNNEEATRAQVARTQAADEQMAELATAKRGAEAELTAVEKRLAAGRAAFEALRAKVGA